MRQPRGGHGGCLADLKTHEVFVVQKAFLPPDAPFAHDPARSANDAPRHDNVDAVIVDAVIVDDAGGGDGGDSIMLTTPQQNQAFLEVFNFFLNPPGEPGPKIHFQF